MRRILTISLIFIGLSTSAQNEWGKHGAEWFYETGFVTYTGYVHCKVEKDTLIGGKTAQIIACREYTVTWGSRDTFQRLDQYTYTDSNKVYYYRFGNWYTLYLILVLIQEMPGRLQPLILIQGPAILRVL